jgi:hypothetical protein
MSQQLKDYIEVLVGIVELLNQTISNRVGGGLVGVEILEVKTGQAQSVLNMINDLLLD